MAVITQSPNPAQLGSHGGHYLVKTEWDPWSNPFKTLILHLLEEGDTQP